MQELISHKPVKLVTDKSEAFMAVNEATYIKNYRIGFNKNQFIDGQDGGNYGVGTGYNSTTKLPPIEGLPDGINVVIGAKNAIETNELYIMYWNSSNIHTIFVMSGDTLQVDIVDIGSHLKFSLDPKHRIPDHRAHLRVFYTSENDKDRLIKEKVFMYTDGNSWQRWINVRAAVATHGFAVGDYPYFELTAPHFDREELIDYAVRPPQLPPVLSPVAVLPEDYGKPNHFVDKSIQLAYVFLLTDGRSTTLSPYSVPYVYSRAGCNVNDAHSVRCLDVELNVGSALVEKIQILQRGCGGEWKLYDTIDKFETTAENDPLLIGNDYWKRTNPWQNYQYNPITNTITYRYCGDKECGIYSPDDASRFQSDLPILSNAMTPAGDAILFGNNKYFYDNFDKSLLDQIQVQVNQDEADAILTTKMVNIKVYAYLCRGDKDNSYVWKKTADTVDDIRFGAVFHGITQVAVWPDGEELRFDMRLGSKEGFICYLAGTSYYSIGKQYLVSNNGDKTLLGVVDITDNSQYTLVNTALTDKTGYVLQEFEFNVPAGNYIARLASHKAAIADVYQNTSTYLSGILSRSQLTGPINSNNINKKKEILIRACDGDVDTFSATDGIMYVYLPWSFITLDGDTEEVGRFIDGYVTEDIADNIPVERIRYVADSGWIEYKRNGLYTDHNGFYFDMSAAGESDRSEINFHPKLNCQNPDGTPAFSTNIGGQSRGYFPDRNIGIKQFMANVYGPCNRILVRGKIVDCVGGNALAGVGITVEDSQTYYTNAEGNFELVLHPDSDGIRNSKIFYNSGGSCSFIACDNGCVPLDDYNDSLSPCIGCVERVYPTVFNKSFKVQSMFRKSLKEGGRYGIGIVGMDAAGRPNFINNIAYKDIPSFLEEGKFIPSSLSWSVPAGLKFPSWVKWVSFFITNNLNNRKYLQWLGDKMEFLDANGEPTATGNGAILAKVSIQSLLDYNVANNFSSVTNYQFVKGDRIRFYDDGSGNLFGTDTEGGFMDFTIRGTNFTEVEDTPAEGEVEDGKSLLIDYDSRLLKLKGKCGFWIEIISPRECTDLELYCETANVYPVINGEIAEVISGELNAYDSYFITRKIIVPGCSGKTVSHPFVSSSITDYWGENCNSCGRTLVKDNKAEQTWYTDDVIKSDDSVNEGRVNGLGTFRYQNRKQFKGQEWGGIVAMHAERGIIFFVCFNDWFLTDYNQNYVKATAAGLLQVNLDGNLSEPHQKVGQNYGCDYADTATIDFYDGLVIWQDIKNDAVLLSDYRSITDISAIDNKSYFINKFRYITELNNSLSPLHYNDNLFESAGCIDPVSKCYFLTFRKRRGLSSSVTSFINNEREVFYDMQETIVFDIQAKEWRGFTAFTPEFYARFRRSITGNELVSFAAGGIYFHNSKSDTTNVFYGVKTDQVLEMVFVGEEQKDKLFQSISQDSRSVAYFLDSITTSNPLSYSYLPLPYLKKKEGVFYGSLLRNLNIYPNKNNLKESNLLDGASITGLWAKIRMVRDLNFIDTYSELNYLFLRYTPREKSKK